MRIALAEGRQQWPRVVGAALIPSWSGDRRRQRMPFREDAQLDPSQVEDRRGGGGGIGGAGMAVGGGGIGLLILMVVASLLGVNPGDVVQNLPAQQPASAPAGSSQSLESCQRGSDANSREDCRVVGFVNSIQAFWQDDFQQRGAT